MDIDRLYVKVHDSSGTSMGNFHKLLSLLLLISYLAGVYMISGRLSSRREFTPVPSYGSVFVYMILLNTKCHTGVSHTGASSPRFLSRSEIFIPSRKFNPVSCKRGMTVRFISIKVSSILRHYKTRTPINTALCKHGATFHLAPE